MKEVRTPIFNNVGFRTAGRIEKAARKAENTHWHGPCIYRVKYGNSPTGTAAIRAVLERVAQRSRDIAKSQLRYKTLDVELPCPESRHNTTVGFLSLGAMVPSPQSSYFPSLDKCLNGDEIVISWKAVFSAIESTKRGAQDEQSVVESFLSNSTVRELLAKPFDRSTATAQSKSVFETKTSAINITPSSDARYDIKEVKADALWLSDSAKIDEVSALRIVVQECQARTTAKLLGRFSEAELASIRESAGDSKFTSPVTASLLSRGADITVIKTEFATEDNRRQRILLLYLSERRYFLECLNRLVQAAYIKKCLDLETQKRTTAPTADNWLQRNGRVFVTSDIKNTEQFRLRCIQAIRNNVESIGNGSGWYSGERQELEVEWIRTHLTEATHTMETLFYLIYFDDEFPTSESILRWFELLRDCGFFDQFTMEDPSLQSLVIPLQTASMTASLALLSLGGTLGYLHDANSTAAISPTAEPGAPFVLNTKTLETLHEIMMHAADEGFITAGPPILAWVTILKVLNTRISARTTQIEDRDNLGRFDPRVSTDSETAILPDPYQGMMETIMDSLDDDDPIDFLARRAVNQSHVLETLNAMALRLGNTAEAFFADETGSIMRSVILDLLGSSNDGLGYIPEVVEALLSTLLGGQNYWDFVNSKSQFKAFDPVANFIDNNEWINIFFQTAVSRYPFEPQPFLRMIHAVASCTSTYAGNDPKSAVGWLEAIPFFTYQLPEDFIDYETTQEEDNNNNVRLKTPVHLFTPRSNGLYQKVKSRSQALTLVDKDFCIPAGTYGRIISDSVPKVVFWFHQYSGLKYFGKLLETFLTASDLVDATTGSPVDRDSVVEIIDIFATILQGYSKGSASNRSAQEDAQLVLELASSGLNRNRDIITVVFDIFEEELHRQSTTSGSEVPLGILVSCIHFIHALVAICPGRVWPHLAQSSLLGVNRGGGRLSIIVEGVELILGRYDFLFACTKLYEALIEDVVANAIRRRSESDSPARFAKGSDVGAGIADQVISKVLLHFARYSADVLESSFSWKFISQNDRRRLCKAIATIFDKILRYVYGIENNPKLEKPDAVELPSKIRQNEHKMIAEPTSKLTGVLIPSAVQIVECFLSTSSSSLRFQPILVAFLDGLETPDLTILLNESELWTTQVASVFSFSSTLLRVSNLLGRPPTELAHQMFKAAPLIARLYAVNDFYKIHVVALFEALIVTANNVAEPPSLLGHLGPHTAKNFLEAVSELDKPLIRPENVLAIWRFLSMVVSNKQQWFGNYLLTGKTPREALGKESNAKDSSPLDKSLLTTALERLSNIRELSKIEATAMLDFVSYSQNFYSWTVYASPKHAEFISSMTEYVGTLRPLQTSTNVDNQIETCFQTKILATIAEILAMHMFHARQMRSPSDIPDMIRNLHLYWKSGVSVPSLNSSIHFQLKQNFEARYPKCTLQDLKRTTLEDRQLGRQYFYDVSLADKMLQTNQSWTGVKGNDGHRASLEIVNVNLSLVDAQIALFHSWKVLAIELTSSLDGNVNLQEALIKVSLDCLTANSQSQHSEEIFARLCAQRADLALIITQRLIEAKCHLGQMKQLLAKTWDTIRNFRGTFDRELLEDDTPYYRSLLRLLFIATRAHTVSATHIQPEDSNVSKKIAEASPVASVVLDIIKYVVAMGLRELATKIHENALGSSPEDIALITGILNSCLHIPGIELYQPQIVSIIITNDTARVATTLFSWADGIAIDGDPIYGELSILFLLELSSMPLMAEQLAIDGVLGQIASANITSYLRRGNVSPFAEGTGLQRCYSIWCRGILPFLLNLLDSVQVSIAAEVAMFLNQFLPLLKQCSKAFEAPESSRTASKAQTRFISLSMCSEVHSLALLSFIISGFRESLEGTNEIPEVNLDTGAILENVEFWLGARSILRERILPMGARDELLARQKVEKAPAGLGGAGGSKLEEIVVAELMGIRDILSGGADS
ncbi:hypothetical protein GLAREA_07712 [Glarea lozoyensis ATCC 20868]|uniref:Nucleoporin NUP188 n=1 Tax=Glarea lozoyensis (strain ATCC 20868 / MF5171) TaxID=1116229 RepID=S3E280_GLAL2|nr:uncharacterized protein GLAREA_07712 [Glarea lozoyensis ATCC 20868]EPE32578.1 hypothetical protein GLAREA_07712 [Glarea lozoyensis ATCC 20868]